MAKAANENSTDVTPENTNISGKGHATPTRKEREAANKRPLVSDNRSKEARKANRAREADFRAKQRAGLASGDPRYLPLRDQGPQKKYARDYVDARFNIGEMMVPFMFLVIIMTFIPQLETSSVLVLWAFFLVALVDTLIMGIQLRKRLVLKFGTVDKGVSWYASMRAIQLRVLRLPKPQVRRRQYPV